MEIELRANLIPGNPIPSWIRSFLSPNSRYDFDLVTTPKGDANLLHLATSCCRKLQMSVMW